jgi:signal transduction histidine kinase
VGKPENRTPVRREINALIAEIQSLLGPVCHHAGVKLEQDIRFEQTCTVENTFVPDSERVRTAVLNLVLNAIEAAGTDGEVLLKAVCGPNQIVIEVTDTGPGPPEELGDEIFELFITGKPEGVGFGLPLAHQVAIEHQGTLTWKRDNGKTCFRLTLPITQ